MKSFWRAKLSFLSIFFICLLISCDEDCDRPLDGGNAEKHYRMYVMESGNPKTILVMDIPADTLIDSAVFNLSSDEMALNSDKSKIFLTNLSDFTTTVIDAYTLEIDTTLPWYGYYHFDIQRNIGLIVQESSLVKIDGSTFGLLATLNVSTDKGDLDTANGHLYASSYGSGRSHIVYVIDYVNMVLIDSIVVSDLNGNPIGVRTLLPIAEAGRLYIIGSGAYIYDIDSNRVLLQIPLRTANGHFAMSGDHKTVYMSDPGNDFLGIFASEVIWVFDVEKDFVKDYMSVTVPKPSPYSGYVRVPVVYMHITEDGKHLYANGGFVYNYPFLRYDLEEGVIGNAFYPYSNSTQQFNVLQFEIGGIMH